MVEIGDPTLDDYREQHFRAKDQVAAMPYYTRLSIRPAYHATDEDERRGPEGLTESKERLARILFDIGAIEIGESGIEPVYVRLDTVGRFPEVKSATLRTYQGMIEGLDFNFISNSQNYDSSIASSLSDRFQKGMIYPKITFLPDEIIFSDKGKKAVLISGNISNADWEIKIAESLRRNGLEVNDLVSLLDMQDNQGHERLKQARINLHSAYNPTQLLDFYSRIGRISQRDSTGVKQTIQETGSFSSA